MRTKDPAIRRTMWFFAIVYAVEGIGQARTGLVAQPLSYWLKQTLHWTPVTISASLAILDLPWVIKPVWGAISDFVPLFGYRRRPYLVLANIAGFLAFAWVATIETTNAMIPALTVISSPWRSPAPSAARCWSKPARRTTPPAASSISSGSGTTSP